MSKSFTTAEVAKHKDEKEGFYVIIDTGVYNVTGRFSLPAPGFYAPLAPDGRRRRKRGGFSPAPPPPPRSLSLVSLCARAE